MDVNDRTYRVVDLEAGVVVDDGLSADEAVTLRDALMTQGNPVIEEELD